MRYSLLLVLFILGCSSSDTLNEDDMRYIAITSDLAKAKTGAGDSTHLRLMQDSVFKHYNISLDEYRRLTIDYSNAPQRAQKVFRVIEDTLRSAENK